MPDVALPVEATSMVFSLIWTVIIISCELDMLFHHFGTLDVIDTTASNFFLMGSAYSQASESGHGSLCLVGKCLKYYTLK